MSKHNTTPLGVAFVNQNRCYYYDTNKNNIIQVNPQLFAEIKDKLSDYPDQSVSTEPSIGYQQLMSKGYFQGSHITNIELLDKESIKTQCANNIMQLILQVTQECNFLCRYCIFAGDGSFARTHSPKSMSFEVAKSAIDYLYDHSVDNKEILVTFYGGEPLLNFKLVKQSIEYCEKLFKIKRCIYSITTNGTLLTSKVIDFLYAHKVMISISLDGPKDIQNASRRFAHNGTGTFDTVYKNVKYLANHYPEYFKDCVKFQPVINPSSNIPEIFAFFKTEFDTDPESISVSYINTSGLNIVFDKRVDNGVALPDEYTDLSQNQFYDYFCKRYNDKREIPNVFHHFGPCIPGAKKLFVNTDGEFFPCEKVSEKPSNSIGNITSGLDYERIYNIVNIGNVTAEECSSCWCIRFCRMCISDIDGENENQIKTRKELICKYQKKRALLAMKQRIDTQID